MRFLLRSVRRQIDDLRLPAAARDERRRDHSGLPESDPGIEATVEANIQWLCRAQDRSLSNDGGVAHNFSLISGWSTSYPETTGYIVPTMLDWARRHGEKSIEERARRMLDWLVSIQFSDGSFQGGRIDSTPKVPVTFNTGQILFGLASGVEHFGREYLEPMRRAALWLAKVQDSDGAWRKHPSPFTPPGPHTYETHTCASMFEADRVDPGSGCAEAALANVRWAITQQEDDGWLQKCSLYDGRTNAWTHTIGYALRGILAAFSYSGERAFLESGQKIADSVMALMPADGLLPGLIDRPWHGVDRAACLTGTVQISYCWMQLYLETGESRYRDAALLANRFVRRSISVEGPDDTRGAVKGSFPVDGPYCPYEYPNWASKFSIDANLLELDIRVARSCSAPSAS